MGGMGSILYVCSGRDNGKDTGTEEGTEGRAWNSANQREAENSGRQ